MLRKQNIRKYSSMLAGIITAVCFCLPLQVFAYIGTTYEIDEWVIDSGGEQKTQGSGYEHSSIGQTRASVNKSSAYELLDGYLYYDDDPPIFPATGSTDPNFMFWIQNINPTSATFYIHVVDDTVPAPTKFQMRSGLDLLKVYYKASPDKSVSGSWGWSDAAGSWNSLGDGAAFADWKAVDAIEADLGSCAAHISCITDTEGAFDNISFAERPNAETIRVTADFTNHTDPTLQLVSANSAVVFKIVDMAGNVAFSQEISSTPWLKTEDGDVHSNKKIIMFNTPPEANVAYMVSAADTILNMESDKDWEISNYPSYLQPLFWPELDYDILISKAQSEGREIAIGDLGDFVATKFVDQATYYKDGNLAIGTATGYAGVEGSGAATVIVDGDLSIMGDVVLNEGGYLAFLVRGNINLSGTVAEIHGTYVSDFNSNPGASGVIDTGDDRTSPEQLRVVGQLIARGGFRFNRVYIGGFGENKPAELMVYDPQVVINTPPGLKEVPSLGSWEEVAPH